MIRKEYLMTVLRRWQFALLVGLLFAPLGMRAQTADGKRSDRADGDSIVIATFYFSLNNGEWIEKSEYAKTGRLLRWAQTDTEAPIHITGWTDRTGTAAGNERLSLRRARTVRNYLVSRGIAADRITIEGYGVDMQAVSDDKARRAEVRNVLFIAAQPVAEKEKDAVPETTLDKKETGSAPKEVNSVQQAALPVEEKAAEQAEKQVAQTAQEKSKTPPVDTLTVQPKKEQPPTGTTTGQKPADTPQEPVAAMQNNGRKALSRWYIGGGAGIAFGRGTLCSFAADGTRPGWNVGLLGGYRINRLLSAEVSLDYTRLNLGAYDCCANLWLGADGNRYYAPVAGMDSYSYKELRSVSNLVSLGAHLNVDVVSIWKEDSRWSALVTPAIYAVYSSAKVKQGAVEANKTSGLHFGLGADLGVQYMITPQWGVRLTTGIDYITGKPIDAMPRTEHKSNYVWNTGLKVIFKLK